MVAKWSEVVKSVQFSHNEKVVWQMTGEYQHSLDAKGRLFIPARLREELGSEFYLTVSGEKCLHAYDAESWHALEEKAKALPIVAKKNARVLFSSACKCEPDSQGRILIPQSLRAFANLTKNVAVLGVNDHAEFWDSEAWEATKAEVMTPEMIAAMLQELGL